MKRIIPLILFCELMLAGCSKEPLHKSTRLFMGTYFDIEIPRASLSARIIDEAYQRIKELDSMMTRFEDASELSKINSNASIKPVKVSKDMFWVLERSMEVYRASDGAFDITIGPLMELWGFGLVRNLQIPSEEEIKKTLEYVGSRNIELDERGPTIFFKKAGLKIDLGGVAKGYAIDEAVRILKGYNIKSGIVKGGGEMHLIGLKVDNRPWVIGIRHPRDKNKIIARLGLKDISIATSGDYENYFTVDARRFSHIMDPRTGLPVGEEQMSVTVLAKDSTSCDAFATAVFVLGKDKGIRFIEGQNAACLIVYEDDNRLKILKSRNFDRFCEFYEEVK